MEILVKSYVIDDDNKVIDVIEGNLHKEQTDTLQIGESIFSSLLRVEDTNVGDQNPETKSVIRGKYKIITREELVSEVDIPYIKLTMKQIW